MNLVQSGFGCSGVVTAMRTTYACTTSGSSFYSFGTDHWYNTSVRRQAFDVAGELQAYRAVLLAGTSYFKPPNPESRKLVEQETKLSIGSKKLPVDQSLKGPALEVSQLLVSTPAPL